MLPVSKTMPSETILLECPYPLITLGLKQVLRAAGYEVRSGKKGPAMEGKAPSLAIYVANDEDVGEDVSRRVTGLKGLVPDVSIVVLGFGSSALPLAHTALKAGARGFLHLGMQPSQLAQAIRLACQGEVVFPRELVPNLIQEEETPSAELLALTGRQREVLELLGEGLTNAGIARRLFVAEGTVKQHLRATYRLLNVRSRVQAVELKRWSSYGRTTERGQERKGF
jgi:DNA-binding NarL/FixJ family response regulator